MWWKADNFGMISADCALGTSFRCKVWISDRIPCQIHCNINLITISISILLLADLGARWVWWRPWSRPQSWKRGIRKWLHLSGSLAVGSSGLNRTHHQTQSPGGGTRQVVTWNGAAAEKKKCWTASWEKTGNGLQQEVVHHIHPQNWITFQGGNLRFSLWCPSFALLNSDL